MYNCETTYIPARQGEAWTTKADISKTQEVGYEPKETLNKYVEEFLKNN